MAAAYQFDDMWRLNHPPSAVWRVLADPTSWPTWWPGLRAQVVREGGDGGLGTRGALTFAAPGYRLRIGLEVVAVAVPAGPEWRGGVVLRCVGDLRGRAVATVSPSAGQTLVRIDWRVAVARPGLRRALAPLPCVARASHAVVMRAGERGLERALAHAVS